MIHSCGHVLQEITGINFSNSSMEGCYFNLIIISPGARYDPLAWKGYIGIHRVFQPYLSLYPILHKFTNGEMPLFQHILHSVVTYILQVMYHMKDFLYYSQEYC